MLTAENNLAQNVSSAPQSTDGNLYERPAGFFRNTAFLTCLAVTCMVTFTALFSGMGKGIEVTESLLEEKHADMSNSLLSGGALLALLLYLLDAGNWNKETHPFWDIVRKGLMAATFISFALGSLLAGNRYSPAPMVLYLFVVPMFIFFLRRTLFRTADVAHFLAMVSIALSLSSAALAVSWIIWVTNDNWWTGWKVKNSIRLGCLGSVADDATARDTANECLLAYLVWFAPMMAATLCVTFGGVLYFLSHSLRGTGLAGVRVALKFFSTVIGLACLGLWVASSVAGAGMRMSNAVVPCIVLTLVGAAVIICTTYGVKAVRDELMRVALLQTVSLVVQGDWTKALFILCGTPFFGFYLLLSAIKQQVRLRWSVASDAQNSRSLVTDSASQILAGMRRWAWSSVLLKSVYLALFYLAVNVIVAKVVTLVLAYLNFFLANQNMGLFAVTFIFVCVGLVMFLLPPVPGVPVYVAGGVILTNASMKDYGFFGGMFFTTGVCFLIKLCAIAVQQKGIGGGMQSRVSIRKACGVNSVTIRAIKRILEQKGFHMSKVCILCGGPDWPTSVLTGILGLSLFEMLLGSLPVVFVIAPCVFAGGFRLKFDQYSSEATITLAVAAMMQMLGMAAAMYFIEKTAKEHAMELRAIENDKEVEKLDLEDAAHAEAYRKLTDWHATEPGLAMSTWAKVLLVVAWASGFCCCAVAWFFGSYCFETITFEMTEDQVRKTLKNDWTNLFRRDNVYGCLFLGTCASMVLCLVLFRQWAARRTKMLRTQKWQVAPEPEQGMASSGSTASGLSSSSSRQRIDSMEPEA